MSLREMILGKPEPKPVENSFYNDLYKLQLAAMSRIDSKLFGSSEETWMEGTKRPKVSYSALLDLSDSSWVLQTVYDAIIREVLRMGFLVNAKFNYKCPVCKKEFQKEPKDKLCLVCKTVLIEPDSNQKKILDTLIETPNKRDQTLHEIIQSLVSYDLTVDDVFLEIAWEYPPDDQGNFRLENKIPQQIGNLDSGTVFVKQRQNGSLGSNEYFCPICKAQMNGSGRFDATHYQKKPGICKKCNNELQETFYIQESKDGTVINRWASWQVIHAARRRRLPNIMGRPLLLTLLQQVKIIEGFDRQNLLEAQTGQTGKIFIFPGASIEGLKSIIEQIKTQVQTALEPVRNYFLASPGLVPPVTIDATRPSRDNQTLEWYEKYQKVICSVYSVQLKWVGIETPGRLGNFDIDVQVQEPAITSITRHIQAIFNMMFKKYFGITDWEFQFGEFRREDEEKKWDIESKKATVISQYDSLGYDAQIDDDGNLDLKKKELGYSVEHGKPKKKKINYMHKIEDLKTFPAEFESTFWEIILNGTESGDSLYDIMVRMEEALSWEATPEDIDNIRRIATTEVMRIHNIVNVEQWETYEAETGEQFLYDFMGRPPEHPKCCIICAAIIKEVRRIGNGKGIPLGDLKRVIEQFSHSTWDLPHPRCCHWIQRVER